MDVEVPAPQPIPLDDPGQYPGFWTRFGRTFVLAFTHPFAFFERIPAGEGVGRPLGFLVLLSVPFYLFLCLYPLIFGFMGLMSRLGTQGDGEPPFGWMALGCLGGILLVPLLQILAVFVTGYVQYAFLRLWGVHDPQVTLDQDLRAWILANAFMVLAVWTPLGPVAQAGVLVMAGLGYARMHRVEPWRGVAAALSMIGLGFLLLVGFFLATFLLASHGAAGQPGLKRTPPSFSPAGNLMPPPGASPAAILDLHVEQARVTLNGVGRSTATAGAAVDLAISRLEAGYPQAGNPFDPSRPGFRKGQPGALGEVGLEPDEASTSSMNDSHRAVVIRAWTPDGVVKRTVYL